MDELIMGSAGYERTMARATSTEYRVARQAAGIKKRKLRARGRRLEKSRQRQAVNRFASGSSAGRYPYKRSGNLRRNIQMEFDRASMTARVGTNVLYGRYLEFGTRRMAPRPWLSLALRDFGPQLRSILNGEGSVGGPIGSMGTAE